MMQNNIDTAIAYYQAMNAKNIPGVEKYLHPNVRFITPLADITGKEALMPAIRGFMSLLKTLTIRATCASEDQVMLAYNVEFPAPIGVSRSVAFMTFNNGLITHIELFYDARPFEEKKKEIFKN